MGQFWGVYEQREHDPDLLYGGAAAVNRAITDFCKNDPRLIPVGFIPLDDAAPRRARNRRRAQAGLRHLLDSGDTGR